MADITTTEATYFIPEIWAQTALEVLRNNVVLAKLVTTDSDVTGNFSAGSVLHIPYPGTFSANDKTENNPVTLQTPSGSTEVQVTLNKHKEVSFLVEDVVNAQVNQDIMARYSEAAVIALAEQIETDLWGLAASFTNSVGAYGTNATATTIQAAMKQLNVQKAPQANRNLVIHPKDQVSILADSNLQTYFAFSQQQGIREGSVGRAYGFDVWMSQLAPVTAGTPNETNDLAFIGGNNGAIILAMRPFKPIPEGIGARVATVRDPVSGLMLRTIMAYNPNYVGIQVTFDVLYGVQILRDAKGVLVKT